MEAIGGIIAALLSAAAQSQAQNDQKNLGYANLYETKRGNRKREKLATSTQEDALGNRVRYDPAAGRWIIEATPTTKGIMNAEQYEQLTSLREDAGRNREARNRRDERSKLADDEFETVFNNYKYRPKANKAGYEADAISDSLRARKDASANTAAAVNKSLIRSGGGSNIPAVFNAARDAEADEFESVLSGAKSRGRQNFYAEESANNSLFQQELGFLQGLADDSGEAPVRFGNDNARMSGQSDAAMAELLQVLQGNESSRQNAMGTLINVAGNSVDFAPLASALGKLGSLGAGMSRKAGPGVAPKDDETISGGFFDAFRKAGYTTRTIRNAF